MILQFLWLISFGWVVSKLSAFPRWKTQTFFDARNSRHRQSGNQEEGLTRKFHKRITDFSTSYARFQKGLWIEFCNAQWSFSGSNGLYPTFFFLHNQWSWEMQEKTVHLINLFYLDSAITYNEEEVDFPASWKIMLLQKEANSSLFSSWMSVILISFCGAPHPSKQE